MGTKGPLCETGGEAFRRIASTACSCMGPFDLSRGGGKRDMQPFVEGKGNGGIVEAAVGIVAGVLHKLVE